ncbi:salivary glue protein Sgs-3-like isoform X2, partial [Clarias magur]
MHAVTFKNYTKSCSCEVERVKKDKMKLIYFAVLLLAVQRTVVRMTGGNGHQRKPTTYITYTASDKELQSAVDVKPQVACPPFVTISNIREKKKIPWSVRYLRKKTKQGLRRTQMNMRINTCVEETSATRTPTDLMTIKEAETTITPNTFTTSLRQRTGGRFIGPVPSPKCCTKTSAYR